MASYIGTLEMFYFINIVIITILKMFTRVFTTAGESTLLILDY